MLPGDAKVSVPPQTAALELATVTPAGSESVKPIPVSELPAFGFVMVKVRLEVWLVVMVDGLNEVAMLGGNGALTVSVALELLPLPPSFELTALVELDFVPAVVPVTVTLN
jgi:hypothetical protein